MKGAPTPTHTKCRGCTRRELTSQRTLFVDSFNQKTTVANGSRRKETKTRTLFRYCGVDTENLMLASKTLPLLKGTPRGSGRRHHARRRLADPRADHPAKPRPGQSGAHREPPHRAVGPRPCTLREPKNVFWACQDVLHDIVRRTRGAESMHHARHFPPWKCYAGSKPLQIVYRNALSARALLHEACTDGARS